MILAGGRSSRFGSDKLAARLGDRTLLDLAIAGVAAVASEIVVVLAPGDERIPERIDRPVRFVADPERHGGPLIGLLAGLEAVEQPLVVVAGADMPTLAPAVLGAMVRALVASGPGWDGVILASRGDRVPLPAVLRTGAATAIARQLVGDGERRLRSLFERLPTRALAEGEWRPLDPAGATLRDVDRPADLVDREATVQDG
ncbi:MAG TPA: molybdenum cofactor guanylyltransferase [Candidatus Limnocylindrales bacterium]|nr:molybdenum cofactor guanylyltransferase [Candidatus Limnocylindrales bacterium]